jgi:hypothetical protein
MKGTIVVFECGFKTMDKQAGWEHIRDTHPSEWFWSEAMGCTNCHWAHPDTCAACRAGEKTVVMAVGTKGAMVT